MNVLVIHGPNLNLLGEREPDIYGTMTLADLEQAIRTHAESLGHTTRFFQSNHEGALIDELHAQRGWADAVLINPGALTHYSYALRDAIAAIRPPTYEVHLSDITAREPWRAISVIRDACAGVHSGHGKQSYFHALDAVTVSERR